MLLADRKGDYLDFSSDGAFARPFRHSHIAHDQDRASMCSSNSLHFPDFLQVIGGSGGGGTTLGNRGSGMTDPLPPGNTTLFSSTTDVDQLLDDSNCTLTSSSSGHSIFLGKESPPLASNSPKPSSPEHDASKSQTSSKPGSQLLLHSGEQSPKPLSSPLRLHVDQQSLDTVSNCSRLSYVSSGHQSVQNDGVATSASCGVERQRPMSLLLARDRSKDENFDRYVKEPTKLLNLNVDGYVRGFMGGGASRKMGRASGGGGGGGRLNGVTVGVSGQSGMDGGTIGEDGNGTGEDEVLDPLVLADNDLDSSRHFLRRRSDGMLNMNSDGYVSFLELHPPRWPNEDGGGHDAQDYPLPDLPQIQITMTEDL